MINIYKVCSLLNQGKNHNPVLITLHHLFSVLFYKIHKNLVPCTNPMWFNLNWAMKYIVVYTLFHLDTSTHNLFISFMVPLSFFSCLNAQYWWFHVYICVPNVSLAIICVVQFRLYLPASEIHINQELLAWLISTPWEI